MGRLGPAAIPTFHWTRKATSRHETAQNGLPRKRARATKPVPARSQATSRVGWGPAEFHFSGAGRRVPPRGTDSPARARAQLGAQARPTLPPLSSGTRRSRERSGTGTGTGTFTGTSALTPFGSSCRGRALILGEKQSACGLKPATPQARSSVVEHYLDTVGVDSSILSAPTKAAVSSVILTLSRATSLPPRPASS
jgi:hypothetical protein